jgi:protein-L-isoaspartate(D-aspartate) O-methyltransferase
MSYIDFISAIHTSTQRDYLARVNEFSKAEAATVAKKFGKEYWDGDRKFGYGGMRYDGRWRAVAEAMAAHYGLQSGDRILDVGCGKAYLLYDFTQVVPGIEVRGLDISEYAIENAKEEVRPHLQTGHANHLPFEDQSFDLVISINTLHNLHCYDLERALREVQRVGRQRRYVCVESYRNEEEKMKLLYWQLTCEGFYTPAEWEWWFRLCGYDGDWSFIFFE